MLDMSESDAPAAAADMVGLAAGAAPSLNDGDLDLGQRCRRAVAASQRIQLSGSFPDALLGPAGAPGSLEARLRSLAESVAELLADPDQVVRVEVSCAGACPPALRGVVLSCLQELVGNAVKHGFYARLVGRIRVTFRADPSGIRLSVADDGWGLCHRPGDGQGLQLVRALIAPAGGTLALRSGDGLAAEVVLPSIVPDNRFTSVADLLDR